MTFGIRGGREAGRRLIEAAAALQPPRERRRRQVAGDPPGLDDPSAAHRRRAARRAASALNGAPLDRHRERRRPDLGPRAGARSLAAAERCAPAHNGRGHSILSKAFGAPFRHEPGVSEVGERNTLGLPQGERYRILTEYRTIAMVGLSANYYNASAFAAIYLDANGYDIVPVNPAEAGQGILGRTVYKDLHEAAEGHPRPIEIVDVFRPPHEAPRSPSGGRDRGEGALAPARRDQRASARRSRRAAGSTSSWIAAARSSTRDVRRPAHDRPRHRDGHQPARHALPRLRPVLPRAPSRADARGCPGDPTVHPSVPALGARAEAGRDRVSPADERVLLACEHRGGSKPSTTFQGARLHSWLYSGTMSDRDARLVSRPRSCPTAERRRPRVRGTGSAATKRPWHRLAGCRDRCRRSPR